MLHQLTAFDGEGSSRPARRPSPAPTLVMRLTPQPAEDVEVSEARERLALMRDPTFVFAIFVGIYLILAGAMIVLGITVGDGLRNLVRRLDAAR